jgi:hypothetical protein
MKNFYFFLLFSLAFSCNKTPEKPAIVPGPAIPGLNLSGGYDCVAFGFMKIKQVGAKVTGTYDGMRRNGDNGTFAGTIEGDLLRIEWKQPGKPEAAIFPLKGKAWLRIKSKGTTLEGKWGYEESDEDGGEWKAEKSQFYVE